MNFNEAVKIACLNASTGEQSCFLAVWVYKTAHRIVNTSMKPYDEQAEDFEITFAQNILSTAQYHAKNGLTEDQLEAVIAMLGVIAGSDHSVISSLPEVLARHNALVESDDETDEGYTGDNIFESFIEPMMNRAEYEKSAK